MAADVFVNNAIDESIKNYLEYKEQEESIVFNGFLVSVIRMLLIIYGDEIIEDYENKNSKAFNKLLAKYGYEKELVKEFRMNFERTYKAMVKQEDKAIKKKNKYFNVVQKHLIDMLVKRHEKEEMDKNDIMEFYNLLFTANNSDFYRKSVAVKEAYDPYEIDDYFKEFNLI